MEPRVRWNNNKTPRWQFQTFAAVHTQQKCFSQPWKQLSSTQARMTHWSWWAAQRFREKTVPERCRLKLLSGHGWAVTPQQKSKTHVYLFTFIICYQQDNFSTKHWLICSIHSLGRKCLDKIQLLGQSVWVSVMGSNHAHINRLNMCILKSFTTETNYSFGD